MMSISVEASAARDSLSDDKELIHTYEVICFFPFLWLGSSNLPDLIHDSFYDAIIYFWLVFNHSWI